MTLECCHVCIPCAESVWRNTYILLPKVVISIALPVGVNARCLQGAPMPCRRTFCWTHWKTNCSNCHIIRQQLLYQEEHGSVQTTKWKTLNIPQLQYSVRNVRNSTAPTVSLPTRCLAQQESITLDLLQRLMPVMFWLLNPGEKTNTWSASCYVNGYLLQHLSRACVRQLLSSDTSRPQPPRSGWRQRTGRHGHFLSPTKHRPT